MSEPDYPYNKKPKPHEAATPQQPTTVPPPPNYPPTPPAPPPLDTQNVAKFSCKICGKTFTTQEELLMHMQTQHQSPKKKV
jgi:hypothetical protein